MSKLIFINLPVTDLAASTRFYTAIGCVKNEQFSDDTTASSMVWSETITFQLLTHQHFADFTTKPMATTSATCEVMVAMTCEQRQDVEDIITAAAANGGDIGIREAQDMGWMNRTGSAGGSDLTRRMSDVSTEVRP